MKKWASILVIALAMVHIAGFTPFYVAALEEVKKEAAIELGLTANLLKVVVSASEMNDASVFEMHKHGEFTYRGKMYDYKKAVQQNGAHVFYAVQDDKEDTLLDCLKAVFADSHSKESKGPLGKLLKNFSKDYLTNGTVFSETEHTLCSNIPVFATGLLCPGFANGVSYPPDIQG